MVVIEEFLQGFEVSVLAFTDGQTLIPMPPKPRPQKALDQDLRPNTGGMAHSRQPQIYQKDARLRLP